MVASCFRDQQQRNLTSPTIHTIYRGKKKQKEMVKSVEETRLNLGVWKQTLWFGRQTQALTMLQRP
jgi:hypothetical protein